MLQAISNRVWFKVTQKMIIFLIGKYFFKDNWISVPYFYTISPVNNVKIYYWEYIHISKQIYQKLEYKLHNMFEYRKDVIKDAYTCREYS